MKLTFLALFGTIVLFIAVVSTEERQNTDLVHGNLTRPTSSTNETSHLRQKRQDIEPYFPDYYNAVDLNDYPGSSSNYLVPAGIAGGTGLALKAVKAKAKLKGLLAIPAGIALLGGIAALASGILPPAAIGGINLPFQGKRRKRNINENLHFKVPVIDEKKFLRKSQMLRNKLIIKNSW